MLSNYLILSLSSAEAGPTSHKDAMGRILHGKGGGGGDDGGAAQREAERQQRIADGTAAVNALFGVGPSKTKVKVGEKVAGYRNYGNDAFAGVENAFMFGGKPEDYLPTISVEGYEGMKNGAAAPSSYDAMFWGMTDASAPSANANLSSWVPFYEDVYEERESPASLAAKQRQALYDSSKEDARKYYAEQLEEDRADAARKLKFEQARRGVQASSQANDMDAEFQKALDRGLIDVANRADSVATNFKNSDEQARLNLITKIVNGVDQGTAVQNAMSTLQTNAEQAKQGYQAESMGNVFNDLLGAYNINQYNQGANAARQKFGSGTGNYFANNSGSSGTTSSSGW